MESVIRAAENLPSFITPAMYLAGIMSVAENKTESKESTNRTIDGLHAVGDHMCCAIRMEGESVTLKRTEPACLSRVGRSHQTQLALLHWELLVHQKLIVPLEELLPDHRIREAVFDT